MTRLDRFRDIFLARHAKPSEVVKSTGNRDRVRITRTVVVFMVCIHLIRFQRLPRSRNCEFLLNDLFIKFRIDLILLLRAKTIFATNGNAYA